MPSQFLQRQKNDLIRDVTTLGSLFFYFILMIIFLISGNYEMFNKLLIGLAIIYPITIMFRTFMFKNRPKKIKYDSYIGKLDAASFPSLHASRTGFLAIFLINYFHKLPITLVFGIIALGVLYSRIYLRKHDFKDVIAGVILGALAYFVVVSV